MDWESQEGISWAWDWQGVERWALESRKKVLLMLFPFHSCSIEILRWFLKSLLIENHGISCNLPSHQLLLAYNGWFAQSFFFWNSAKWYYLRCWFPAFIYIKKSKGKLISKIISHVIQSKIYFQSLWKICQTDEVLQNDLFMTCLCLRMHLKLIKVYELWKIKSCNDYLTICHVISFIVKQNLDISIVYIIKQMHNKRTRHRMYFIYNLNNQIKIKNIKHYYVYNSKTNIYY